MSVSTSQSCCPKCRSVLRLLLLTVTVQGPAPDLHFSAHLLQLSNSVVDSGVISPFPQPDSQCCTVLNPGWAAHVPEPSTVARECPVLIGYFWITTGETSNCTFDLVTMWPWVSSAVLTHNFHAAPCSRPDEGTGLPLTLRPLQTAPSSGM